MALTQTQKQALTDNHRFRVLRCGRRWGKTTLACKEIKALAVSKPVRIAYVAPTIQQARDIMWEMLLKELRPAIIKAVESPSREIIIKTVGGEKSLIQLRGWEAIETLRGQAFDFLILDEVAQYKNFWSNWEEVLRPTLTDRRGQVLFASTPKGFNHFYDLCNKELKDKDFKSFHFTSYDNPYLPVDELESAKQSLPNESFLQEYMASFQKTQGLVYKEFNREKHLYDSLPGMQLERVAGVDFGYVNPAAVLDIRTDGETFFVEDEWYKRERTDIQIAEYVSMSQFEEVYPDPESPQAIEELKRKNVNIREVIKGKDSIENGIKKIKELLISNKLKINRKCVNLISEFEMYSYEDEKAEVNQKEKPIKANDHCLVGDTMITMGDGSQKKLRDIKVGELVKTRKGINKVLLSRLTRKNADIYEIELSNGYKLRGTGDHKIYTDRGKIAIDALRYDDNIKVLETNKILLWKKQLFSKANATTGILNTMLQVVATGMGANDCIRQYGSDTMGKSQRDIIYITGTEIQGIINSLTSYLLTAKNTYQNIIKETGQNQNLEKKLGKILKVLDHLQKNGIVLNKVLNGINKMEKNAGLVEKLLTRIVNYAVKNLKHTSPQEQDFAIRIVGRKRCGKEDVYNLTVENEHNYYANGILVKNCLDALRYVVMMKQPEIIIDQFHHNLHLREENSAR
jgi:PBSX family phage terminase large subunit